MERYKVIIAYDGTSFAGFQRQVVDIHPRPPAGQPTTVQGEIETALRRLGWTGQTLLAAGRTDTGVHALGQVVAFDLEWRRSLDTLLLALNANLPPAISVRAVSRAASDFHPRYDARSRRYHYTVYCDPVRNPLAERYAWRVWHELDLERMQQAAAALVGRHDFAAFGTPPRAGGSTVRTVSLAEWQTVALPDAGVQLRFAIQANAFLYRMVRRIVGLLVNVGAGRQDPASVADLLVQPPPGPIQALAPAAGLCLVAVHYAEA